MIFCHCWMDQVLDCHCLDLKIFPLDLIGDGKIYFFPLDFSSFQFFFFYWFFCVGIVLVAWGQTTTWGRMWWSQFSAFKPNGLRFSQLSGQNQDQKLILPQVTPLQHIGFPTGSQDIQFPTFQKDRSTGYTGIINRLDPESRLNPQN